MSPEHRSIVAAIEQLAARLPHEPPPDLEDRLLREVRRRASRGRTAARWRLAVAASLLTATAGATGWLAYERANARRTPRAMADAPGPRGAGARPAITPVHLARATLFLQMDDEPLDETAVVVRVRVRSGGTRRASGGHAGRCVGGR